MRKQPQIYKSFLIIPRGGRIQIFDIAGKVYAEADSIADAQKIIADYVSGEVKKRKEKKPEKRTFAHLLGNPPLTKIYDCIKEVIAVKGPGHKCDAACKRANHTYRHVFTKKHGIYGTADGQKLIIE